MKRIALIVTSILVITTLGATLIGCSTLTQSEGMAELKTAYANTRDNYNDIYQYREKIYEKAVLGVEGYIINRVVNVNCAVDKNYNLLKDTNYAINIHEDRYLETIDKTSKLTAKQIAYNEIFVGETTAQGDKKNKVDALFVSSSTEQNSGKIEGSYVDVGENAKDFYNSEYFTQKQLLNTQIMEEIGALEESDMNFDIDKGGIVKKGRTTDFTFKVTDKYLEDYETAHGKKSLLQGDKVWVQLSYDRIANIYVYKTEQLGGNLTSEYEAYSIMITYLGRRVDMPKVPASSEESPAYTEKDIFSGGVFVENILSPII